MATSALQISSTANEKIKHLVQLSRKSALREKERLFVVEGYREINRAYQCGFEVHQLFYCPEFLKDSISEIRSEQLFEVSAKVYEKIAYRQKAEGIVATLRMNSNRLEDISFSRSNPLVLVIESPEKPGNIGALLRTAAVANLDALIVTDPGTSIYNANCIRASLGGFFALPIALCSNDEAINFLKAHHFQVLTALIDENSTDYQKQDFTKRTAIVLGTEADGLSNKWMQADFQPIQLPMPGKVVDSLNLSVSGGILMYEALRQRSVINDSEHK